MKKIAYLLALVVVAALGIAQPGPASAADASTSTVAPFPAGITRLAGATRYDTALAVSKRYAPGVPAVFVATGRNFPDALSAAAAAAAEGGPLLLIPGNTIPQNVAREIVRLAPQRIYVVGGAGVVTEAVEAELGRIAPVTRLGGATRYDTALKIVSSIFTASTTAIVATGRSFPDALAATGAAGKAEAPVVLVDGAKPTVDPAVVATLRGLGVTSVAIAGGTGAVPAGIETGLRNAGFQVTRYPGVDRYDTAARINNAFFGAGAGTMFLATGRNYPDALAAAALAGHLGAPLYVTTTPCMPDAVRSSVLTLAPGKRVVLGGAAVVSDNAANNLGCLVPAVPRITGTTTVGQTLTAQAGAWAAGTTLSYQWYANGAAIAGATASSLAVSSAVAGKRLSVRVTGTKPGYVTAFATSAPTAVVGYPGRTTPVDSWSCPSWAPIKGNADSMIYHVPGQRYYDRTNPEECFRTERDAVNAGYRRAKV